MLLGSLTFEGLAGPFILWILCFLVGSIPFGFIAGKLNGVDIREKGSGNIGATNVLRSLGKKWGYSVFALDVLKGFMPLVLLKIFYLSESGHAGEMEGAFFLVVAAILVILGHNYCPWLGFKGGKGIASSAGVLLGLVPWTFLSSSLSWVIAFFVTRYVSLASLVACVAVPASTYIFYRDHLAFVVLSIAMGIMGIWRHRSNMKRLLNGTEDRFKPKNKEKLEEEKVEKV